MVNHAEQWNSRFRPSQDRETALVRAWRAAWREFGVFSRLHECEPREQGLDHRSRCRGQPK